jgi:hypothetical protein
MVTRDEPQLRYHALVFSIEYEMRRTGWAYLTVTNDGVSYPMEISYIGPDITDLVWQTAKLLAGSPSATIEFLTEPGEHLWTIGRDDDLVHLRIESEFEILLDADDDGSTPGRWRAVFRCAYLPPRCSAPSTTCSRRTVPMDTRSAGAATFRLSRRPTRFGTPSSADSHGEAIAFKLRFGVKQVQPHPTATKRQFAREPETRCSNASLGLS